MFIFVTKLYRVSVGNTIEENSNVLVAVSQGTWAAKLCSNSILQFLAVGGGYQLNKLKCITAVKWL